MAEVRVFLVDDHPIVLEGLRALLSVQPDMVLVGEASDGLAVLEQLCELRPDVVVMDVTLPHLDGIAAAERILRRWPEMKVIMLTVHEDSGYLRQALKVGASGYVVKRSAAEDLVRAIRIVAAGGTYLDPLVTGQVVQGYVRRDHACSNSHGIVLSAREQEVLRLVSQGLTNRETAAQMTLSTKTVETYRLRAMDKLGLRNRADIVRYALQQGWLTEQGDA